MSFIIARDKIQISCQPMLKPTTQYDFRELFLRYTTPFKQCQNPFGKQIVMKKPQKYHTVWALPASIRKTYNVRSSLGGSPFVLFSKAPQNVLFHREMNYLFVWPFHLVHICILPRCSIGMEWSWGGIYLHNIWSGNGCVESS